MKRNIKNYLPFYLGFELECGDTINGALLDDISKPDLKITKSLKPALRHITDLRDEESLELAKIFNYDIPDDDGVKEELINSYTRDKDGDKLNICNYMSVQSYLDGAQFLISKGIDLFGLIEEGLAIQSAPVAQ